MNLALSSQRIHELPPSRKRKAETVLVRPERTFSPSIIPPRNANGTSIADRSKNGSQPDGRVGQSISRKEHATRHSTIAFYTLSEDRSKDNGRLLRALMSKDIHRFGTRGFLADYDGSATSPSLVASKVRKIQRKEKQEQDHVMQDGDFFDDSDSTTSIDRMTGATNSKPRSLPDPTKIDTWTDRSGRFKVDAQFLRIANEKIHLHKANGVKIAVPLSKMSRSTGDRISTLDKTSDLNIDRSSKNFDDTATAEVSAKSADGKTRSKPDLTKVRTWTDHSGAFRTEAQFLGIANGKLHLHKLNGVKISVAIAKMSEQDLDYAEKMNYKTIHHGVTSFRG